MHFYIHVYFFSIWLSIVSLLSFHLIKIVRFCYLLVTRNRIIIILWIKKNMAIQCFSAICTKSPISLKTQNSLISHVLEFHIREILSVFLSWSCSWNLAWIFLLSHSTLSHQSFKMNLISGLFHKATRD